MDSDTVSDNTPDADLDLVDGLPFGNLPPPEPVPSMEAYLRERRACLMRSPRRLYNYWKSRRAGRRSATVDYLPVRMDFESVSRCNFRCKMCQVSDWPKGKRADDMPFEDFKKVLDQQYGLVEIKIQGFGEPLMQGDDYFRMIRYARARRIWTRTTTNASLLHLKDNYKKLIDSGINEIQVSIDGATRGVFEEIRPGSVFDQVIDNSRLINEYCRQVGTEHTKMWTVVQKDNQHQLFDLIDLAHDAKFRHMAFSFDMIDFGIPEWRQRNDAITVKEQIDHRTAERLIERGREVGIKVGIWSVTTKYSPERPETRCPWPFERAYVSSDMRVVPCCIIGNPEVSDLGDATDLSATWKGNAMTAFRQAHIDGRIPDVCKSCYK